MQVDIIDLDQIIMQLAHRIIHLTETIHAMDADDSASNADIARARFNRIQYKEALDALNRIKR